MKKIKLFIQLLTRLNVTPSSPEDLKKGQVVVAHEFGDQKHVSRATAAIIHSAVKISTALDIDLICQFPGDRQAVKSGKVPLYVIRENIEHPGEYLDTHEVNRQLAEWCHDNDWKHVIVCAHPHHAWRVGQNLRHFGLIPVFPDLSAIPYDEHCPRKVVSSACHWLPRELVARLIYFFKGYLD